MFCAGFMVALRIIIDGAYDTIDKDDRIEENRNF